MCLIVDNTVKVNFNENDEVVCYKLVDVDPMGFYARYQAFKYSLGENVALDCYNKPVPLEFYVNCYSIYYGFHVFLHFEDIIRYYGKGLENTFNRIIQVVCKKEDLIASGYWEETGIQQAVFTKMRIDSFDSVERIAKDIHHDA